MHRGAVIPVVQEISAVTCGLRIHSVNVWEEIFVHAFKSEKGSVWWIAACDDCHLYVFRKCDRDKYIIFIGGSVLFVGVVFREFGQMTGLAFYLSAVLLGFLLAPNKLYVITFAGMGFYIWGREFIWKILERSAGVKRKMQWYRLAKVILFNGLYLPLILGYGELFFGGEISEWLRYSSVLAGQVIFALYDKAYDYVQLQIWGKIRNRLFSE